MKDRQFPILEHWYLIKIGNITKSMWFLMNNVRKIKFFKRLKLNHTQCYYGVFLLQDALKFATTLEKVLYEYMKTVRERRSLSTMDASAPTNKQRWADRYFGPLVRWFSAQRTTDMLGVQRTGKIADQRQRTTKIELPLVRC
jgi:hypothetical protein